jgi:hypothetical protein
MLPMEVADRTLHLSFGDGNGTCFVFDHLGKQYIVTARHVIDGIQENDTIQIAANDEWVPISVRLVGHSEVDVSVMAASQKLAHAEMKLEPAIGGFFIGQEVFFVGFPLEMQGFRMDSPFPVPLLKRAIISTGHPIGAKKLFFLDGHNNPGFSGAPVYLKIPGEQQFKVSMIVASYTATREPVYDGNAQPTDLTVWSNSGIMAAYSIKEAIDLIEKNPIGFDLNTV